MNRVLADRYRLEPLPAGRGGMGEVWLGRDVRLDRAVAVKFVRFPDDDQRDELVRRFVRESRITAGLEHPGVPAVYDVGTDGDTPYMVMQRVDGLSVADLVAEHGPLPVGWATGIAAQACAVLAAAHDRALVHRDLKPGNLMLGPDGTVRVLDFGLAVALASGDSRITRTGEALGTPAYMAPELVMAGLTDPRTDLYALGCTLHEMLTGRRPFTGGTAYAVMHQQVDGRIPDVRALRPDVPAELAALVRSLMAKSPDDRPPSAAEAFASLTPHVRDLAALPGAVPDVGPSPTRMYAMALATVLAPPDTPAPDPPPAPVPRRSSRTPQTARRTDLRRLREQVDSLVAKSRREAAVELLAAGVPPAAQAFGGADPDVISLRTRMADLLFDQGDFGHAAHAYSELVDAGIRAVATVEGRRWRRQEATCLALSGDTATALTRLTSLLDDERADHSSGDDRVLDLRKQLGLLQLGHGDATAAEETFADLLADVRETHGHDAAEARTVEKLRQAAGSARKDS
ncbi:serine/threonine-protein kinase [Pseudonocardia sp. McavD-2-B]|uniref:serine/threonine-protein kinase n=1 Tax=Pseudonocardia sp. McavD-2-B TaxID=2954499 RepID=UPI0027E365A3|nr:serine/threonine-protein kinase [Pseudonocardia sp. McavD-2-B]